MSADLATCSQCLKELFDPTDRRSRYPFINCTHCGPRLSIVRAIPYDRANTSMAAFDLCPHCQREYDDPADRRFHAQPNACPACGPELWVTDRAGCMLSEKPDDDPIVMAQNALQAGKIVAVKGLGGFHLAVDATNEEAVTRLRQRKHRPHKPLAVMVRDIDVAKGYCQVSDQEQELLQSAAAPVVLLQCHTPPSQWVAPNQQRLGVMLPPSPLHHLLLAEFDTPLVMTSGNPSGEPQCIDNHTALEKLADVADVFLLHNRDIINRVDDSVVQMLGGETQAGFQVLRRGRGYAPMPLPLPSGFEQAPAVLALGAELKNTFCLLRDNSAVLSQYIGDLQDVTTLQDFEHSLALYQKLYQHRAECIAVDAHPQYHSSHMGRMLAQQLGLPVLEVQHHHAHMAACLGEHGWPLHPHANTGQGGKVLAVTLDGLGYAPKDEVLWGGEILLGDYIQVQQLARLKPMPLPGGDAAATQPWRNAVAQLNASIGWNTVMERYGHLPSLQAIARQPVDTLLAMIHKSLNAPLSSSCGRLFDAVAAVLGLFTESISFEGQAAMALEATMMQSPKSQQQWQQAEPYPFELTTNNESGTESLRQIDPAPMWAALLEDLHNNVDTGLIAARFHKGLSRAWAGCAAQLAQQHNVTHVVLTGGVFQNTHLCADMMAQLQQRQLTVLTPQQVPANDGGIAFGQALIAAARKIETPAIDVEEK